MTMSLESKSNTEQNSQPQAQPCEGEKTDVQENMITASPPAVNVTEHEEEKKSDPVPQKKAKKSTSTTKTSPNGKKKQCHGKVVKWIPEKGYGFIFHPDTNNDYFFHTTDIRPASRESMNIEEKVTFEFDTSHRHGTKKRAINVRGDGSGIPSNDKGNYRNRRSRRSNRGGASRKSNQSENSTQDKDWNRNSIPRSMQRSTNDYDRQKNYSTGNLSMSKSSIDDSSSYETLSVQNYFDHHPQYAQNQLMYAVLTPEQMGCWQAFASMYPGLYQQPLLNSLPAGVQPASVMEFPTNPPPGFGPPPPVMHPNPPMNNYGVVPSIMNPSLTLQSETHPTTTGNSNSPPGMTNVPADYQQTTNTTGVLNNSGSTSAVPLTETINTSAPMANLSRPNARNSVASIGVDLSVSRSSVLSIEDDQNNENIAQHFQGMNSNLAPATTTPIPGAYTTPTPNAAFYGYPNANTYYDQPQFYPQQPYTPGTYYDPASQSIYQHCGTPNQMYGMSNMMFNQNGFFTPNAVGPTAMEGNMQSSVNTDLSWNNAVSQEGEKNATT